VEKAKQYQDALKQALAEVYAEQEAERKKLLDERAAMIKTARSAATAQVAAARERVAGEVAAARREIDATVGQLSAEIARRILQSPPRPGGTGREAR
jgi:predicted  nucleic acid-binding Zn-ribbon protein